MRITHGFWSIYEKDPDGVQIPLEAPYKQGILKIENNNGRKLVGNLQFPSQLFPK